MEEKNISNILNDYYGNVYNEDERLNKDKFHHLEFITTTKYIEKYLKDGDRILEVGAGTGAYSIYYARKGYKVDAVELVESNLEILKSKIADDMNINAVQGNALDLSMYEDNTFDVTLVLGPLYHLFSKEEIDKAINEAIRVTKPGGKIYMAFILFDIAVLNWGFRNKNIYNNYGEGKQVTEDFDVNNMENLVFYLIKYPEVKKLINKFNIKPLHYVAPDGVGRIMDNVINEMTDEEYDLYVKYHLSTCEREDLIGYSAHLLAICEKE